MLRRLTWWYPCLILAGCLHATAATNQVDGKFDDNFFVDVWDTDRGLPQSTVTSLAQTPDGYLWVGTLLGGVARFDGVRFTTFHPGNTPELPSIEIQKLLVDSQGTLWIGLVEGIFMSRRNGHFQFEREDTQTPFSWLDGLVASRTNEVIFSSKYGWLFRGHPNDGTNQWETIKPTGAMQGSSPCEDRDGTIWYRRANSRLGRLRGKAFEMSDALPGLAHQQINTLIKDSTGRIWVGTPKELAFWDGKKFSNMTPTNGESGINVLQLAPAVDGGIWVRTPDWLRKCDNRRWSVEASLANLEFKESQFPLWIYPDIQGGAWLIKYGSGLWHVDLSGKVSNIGLEQGLPSNLIECWLQDREGNMWVGLVGGGLACVRQRVFHVVWPSKLQTALATRSVCQNTNGEMWFGTSGDSVFQWADGKFDKRTPPQDKIAGADTTVCPDAQGRMWVGTVQNGVWIFETNSFGRPFSSEEIGTVVRALFCDHLGRMWIGNEFGLYCWDHERLKRFTAADGFAPAYVLAITEDDAGTLWLGTAVGELRSYRGGKFTAYRPADALGARHAMARENSVNAESIARGSLSGGERFWAIHADHQGILWIGTLGGGLLRFKDGHFTRYTTLQGLPNEHVSQILEDGRGQFWLGTRSGITRITRAALEAYAQGKIETIPFATYGKFDGLPTIECSGGYQPSCWTGTDGRLWFSTLKGAVWVNPQTLPFNPLPPPVWLEEMRVDKKVVYEMHSEPRSQTKLTNQLRTVIRPDMGSLQIAAGQHFYEFKFTALSLVSPDKVRFNWRLHGAEQEWVGSGTERSVSYTYLPPGNYEFLVQACNNDGVWNEKGARLQFRVLPFFRQTWWFKTLIIMLVTAILFILYSIRIARLRALERLRLRIARDLHDDVGSNLGSISLLSQVMEKHPSPEDARQIHSIVSHTVDTLRDIVWFIDPTHERISDMVARMAETAKSMLPATPYTFEQSGDFSSARLPLDFRRNVMPIFKEALHNANKHAHASQITIQVNCTNHYFQFTIRDNGRGFDMKSTPLGNGLKNFQRRAKEMNAKLDLKSAPGEGTSITLTAKTP